VPQNLQILTEELTNLMTIMYITMQVALDDPVGNAGILSKLRGHLPAVAHIHSNRND
jgi:hypothetical protein